MDEIARNPEDYESGDDPPNIPSPKEKHEHHPSHSNKESKYSNNKFGRFWERHSQQWKDVPVHDKSNAIFTIVIAVATTIYAFVTISQLREMRSSGTQTTEQTRELIAQAKAQATNTHDLALAADTQSKQAIEQTAKMVESLGKTDALIKATAELARQTKRSADMSGASLQLSQDAIHLDERPWIGIIGVSAEGIKEMSDVFTVEALSIEVHNSGKTPAVKLSVDCCVYSSLIWTDPIPDYDQSIADNEKIRQE
ncbi:MAG TPA: hypothetical protein VGK22_19675 [Candidatus Angelobacter sp.]|jgi:hypothetical protein